MDDETFKSLVEESLEEIPGEFNKLLQNVVIIIETNPTPLQLRKLGFRGRGLLLGLYEGLPKTKRGKYGIGGNLPDKITIFKQPIESLSQNISDIKTLVADTVKHEIAHHFGMDEDAIRKTKKK